MPTFEYTALNPVGQKVRGVIAGVNEQAALGELESKKLTPVSMRATDAPRASGRSLSARRLGAAYRQLADLLHAGVPLLRSLKLLGGKKSDAKLADAFRELAEAVAEGQDMASAMERRPEAFPAVHVAMVRAGERGGFLESVLSRLGALVLNQAEMRSKLIGSLIYPMILVGFGSLVLLVLFGFFVPKFRPLVESVPGGAPALTKFVLALSDLVGRYGVFTLAGLGVLFAAAWRGTKMRGVQRALVRWRTFGPGIGPITRSLAASRFCRMLGTMLGNGVPMLSALQIARQAAGNSVMEEAIDRATESVRAGQALAAPLGESGLFEEDVIEMISVGESANNLDSVLVTIADTIESRVDRMLSTLIKFVEPAILVVLALVVVVVAAALIWPMTQLRPEV